MIYLFLQKYILKKNHFYERISILEIFYQIIHIKSDFN